MSKKRSAAAAKVITCRPVLPEDLEAAAEVAVAVNPANRPTIGGYLPEDAPAGVVSAARIAVLTQKWWGSKGVKLTVSFPFDSPGAATRKKILQYANLWGSKGNVNVEFVETTDSAAQVRVARTRGEGYWSYLGTDVLTIPRGQPTMTLEAFTENTPDAEYLRVVPHEFGHTLGCPHEHMRKEIIDLLDRKKTVDYFLRTYGWSARTTTEQVLTPVSEASIKGTPRADAYSCMCYQLPGDCTKSGEPVPGGDRVDDTDYAFMATIYPVPDSPAPPPVEQVVLDLSARTVKLPDGWKSL
jgi:hypothetical protein